MERQVLERQLAHSRATLKTQSDSRRTSVTSVSSSCSSDLERLHEELQLEIQPEKLLRQCTLSVPPSGDSIKRSGLLDASPTALEDVLHRWEKNQVKWRSFTSSDSRASFQGTGDAVDAAATLENGEELFGELPRVETFDATFREGFLGLEFAVDDMKSKVVVKTVLNDAGANAVTQIPPEVGITKGLTVEAINGKDVNNTTPADILDTLQFSRRPMTVKFSHAKKCEVVCKLCETKVDASRLDEHTNHCVLSKRVELEADVINTSLLKLIASITANLESQAMRPRLNQEEMHIYHALRVVAIQASSCDISSVDSFALCSRLVKIIDRIREQGVETLNFAVERGTKYCSKLRNLIHAKMSKMRASHKVLLQQNPSDGSRSPLKRTRSLEDLENSSVPKISRRRSKVKTVSYRAAIHDFQIIKPISKGAFGKVYLARKKTTGDQYAIKVLAKEHLLRKKQMQQIATERNVLANVVSPFVVKLFWTFQTKSNLFLVMEYLPGGDFMSLLECVVQLEEQEACIYIAEIAIALNHLHNKGCVHRDLKPDNILLSSTGHVKLTDFGLSEEGVALDDVDFECGDEAMTHEHHSEGEISTAFSGEKHSLSKKKPKTKKSAFQTFGRCGTPDYLAPEIVLGVSHGPAVDFWALGIILYEMLVGFPPFNDDTVDAIFENILERQILWPDGEKGLSLEAMDLIDKLLYPNPTTRLGFEGMKLHPFFKAVNWDTLLESSPPFVPTLEGPNDTSYFNNRNLTDIFIDDDEFELDSCSSQVDDSGAEGDVPFRDPFEDVEDLNETNDSTVNNARHVNINMDNAADITVFSGTRHSLDATSISAEKQSIIELPLGDNNVHHQFPSGMYGSPEDSPLADAFRSFSFTNMDALAAASQAEADMLADPEQQAVEGASGASIFI